MTNDNNNLPNPENPSHLKALKKAHPQKQPQA
jgi:hypothetical protein